MGVYIKGMEMPKTRHCCRMCVQVSDGDIDWHWECCLLCERVARYATDRILGCPLVPVPPHGRLIDADALIARYEAQRAEDRDILCDERAFPSDYEKAQYRYSRNSDFISALKSQAAIIPEEEGKT